MSNFIQQFHDFMRSHGYEPKGGKIIANGKWNDLVIGREVKGRYKFNLKTDEADGHIFRWSEGPSNGFNWYSRSEIDISPEERKRRKREWAEIQRQQKAFEDRRIAKFIRIAEHTLKLLPKAPDDHPYFVKKGIKAPIGVRICRKRQELEIPLYRADGKIVSVQRIPHNCNGKYMVPSRIGARAKDAYFSIATREENKDVFLICEGVATGQSLREATGYPVVCAMSAGNLMSVANQFREKLPNSKIVVVADNDKYDKKTGEERPDDKNPGIVAAKRVCKEIANTVFVAPDFKGHPDFAAKRLNDFNDIHTTFGLDEVKQQILQVINSPQREEAPPIASVEVTHREDQPLGGVTNLPVEVDWKSRLKCDKHANPVKNSLTNTKLFLQYHEEYKDLFRLDEFSAKIMVTRCPPWEDIDTFKVHMLNDVDITEATASLEYHGISPDRTRTMVSIEAVASKNRFHPARQYFDGLQWDGKDRLKSWLKDYLGAAEDEDTYLSFIGMKWLVAAVKRIYEPGCKFDHILVLEGEQGRGKSTALKILATFGEDIEESYFTDAITIADIQDKDTIQKIQGSVIVELAELSGFNKKDDQEVKRWITLQHDDCRLPYARTTSRFSRQFVLSATVNTYDYLKDPTGNRRYWPAKCLDILLEKIRADRVQLWAEAVKLYKSGFNIGPTPEEIKLAESAQNKRLSVDVWEDDVINTVEKIYNNGFKIETLMKEMGLQLRERDGKSYRRIAAILKSNGYISSFVKENGKTDRRWKKDGIPNVTTDPDNDYHEEFI